MLMDRSSGYPREIIAKGERSATYSEACNSLLLVLRQQLSQKLEQQRENFSSCLDNLSESEKERSRFIIDSMQHLLEDSKVNSDGALGTNEASSECAATDEPLVL